MKLEGVFIRLNSWAREFGAGFVLGLSGGGDSAALLWICREWLKTPFAQSLNAQIFPVIIDHNIAQNSAEVVKGAQDLAHKLGFAAKILKIEEKIATAIQENARKLRYELLHQAAGDLGVNNILLAHNYGDNIETLLFRMARHSDIFGLGIMRAVSLYEHKGQIGQILRPVMDLTRAELREICRENQIAYYDDPANDSLKFARVKLRKRLESGDIDDKKLMNIARAAQKIREYYEVVTFAFIVNHIHVNENHLSFKRNIFCWHSAEMQIFIMGKLLQIIGSNPYVPAREKLGGLCADLAHTGFRARNLGHCLVKCRKDTIIISREPPRKSHQSVPISPLMTKSLIQKARLLCNIVPTEDL